jgi:hypothetical protein
MRHRRAAWLRNAIVVPLVFAGWIACDADPTVDEGNGATGPGGIPSGNPNGANDGSKCAKGFDCKSGVCTGGSCAIPTSTDKVRNQDETGLDCGGTKAPPCGGGQPCNANSDCANEECKEGKCTGPVNPAEPTPTDGRKNGDESDVDCGGKSTGAPPCGTDKKCNGPDDCESKVCSPDKKCAAATATDGVQNGDETDVDCGGTTTTAPKCATGKGCAKHEDCVSDGCDEKKKCSLGRSCTQVNGGQTCGTGEVGEPGAQHESCCISLPIPGRATKLDKYKITAGRMRAFLLRVNGDVLGWFNANKAGLTAAGRAQVEPYASGTYLPTNFDDAQSTVGGYVFLPDQPSSVQGCYVGTVAEGANGAHTFYTDNEGDDRGFDKNFLDRLIINCITLPMAAAFCAWDGGRLQTYDENNAAFGAGPFPWGANPQAGGFDDNGNVLSALNGASCPGCDPRALGWRLSYQNPNGGNAAKPQDYSYFISPPGRFPIDTGAGGHKDLGGVMMEWVYGADGAGKHRWSRAGSWEGHAVGNTGWNYPPQTKYGKVSARCARD